MLPRRLVIAAVCGLILQSTAYADSLNSLPDSDADITNRVVQKLVQADARLAQRIRVSTLNGVVTLEGTVFTPSQILKVADDTGKVTGVVQVKNRLHLQL